MNSQSMVVRPALAVVVAIAIATGIAATACNDASTSKPTAQSGATTGANLTPSPSAAAPQAIKPPGVPAGAGSDDGGATDAQAPRATPPWKSTIPGTIKMVSAGSGAKSVLTYNIEPGTTQQSIMEVQMDIGQGGPTSPRPTIVMEFTTVAGAPAVGGEALTMTFTKFYAKEREHSLIPAAMATEQITKLNGLSLTGHLTANGFLRGVKVHYPDAIGEEAFGTTQGMLRSVEKVLPQLPVVPVGVGAKWEVRDTMKQDGVDVTSVTTVQLVAKRGAKVTLKTATTMTAPPRIMTRDGSPTQVQGIDGKGAMHIEIDLSKPMPSIEQTLDMNIDLGVQFTSKMKLTLTSR